MIKFCENMRKCFPKDATAKARAQDLLEQYRKLRFDFGVVPSVEKANEFVTKVRKMQQESRGIELDELMAVDNLMSGLVSTKDENDNPRTVTKINRAIHTYIKKLAIYPSTLRAFNAAIIKAVTQASNQVVAIEDWVDLSAYTKPKYERSTSSNNNNPAKANKGNSQNGSNNQRGNSNTGNTNNTNRSGQCSRRVAATVRYSQALQRLR
jgi:hypothetical protein